MIDKHILLKGRHQTSVLLEIVDQVIAKAIPLTHYNQLEVLYQLFSSKVDPTYK